MIRSLDDVLREMIETQVENAIRNTCYFVSENTADAVMRKLEERESIGESNGDTKKLQGKWEQKLQRYEEYLNKREGELQAREERLNQRQAELDELESNKMIRITNLVTLAPCHEDYMMEKHKNENHNTEKRRKLQIEPWEPLERMEPLEPLERMEPLEPLEQTELKQTDEKQTDEKLGVEYQCTQLLSNHDDNMGTSLSLAGSWDELI